MAKIVVVGGGICGLGASMMMARRGHEVTVIERNAEEPPDSIEKAWEAWERPGVAQFRMGHWFMARFHQIIKTELPDLIPQFDAVGALRVNPMTAGMPDTLTDRTPRDDDDQFDVITGRRPVFEWVVSRAAASERNVEIRRGVGVNGLLTGPPVAGDIPHVIGVRTDAGEEIAADLVVDAGGRRSAFASWLAAIGAKPFFEESEDSGFRYYGRYFAARPGGRDTVPTLPTLALLGTVAILALPADNDTWMLGVVTAAKDKALYALTDEHAWSSVIAATPAIAPFLEGDAITEIETMMAIPDRYRRFVVDGQPVATGITAIADAWAATNPMRGRGVSMGFLQAQLMIDQLDKLDDPTAFAHAVDAVTEAEAAPHYHGTVELDRTMRDAFEREVQGLPAPPPAATDDPGAAIQAAFFSMVPFDPDAWRAFIKIVNLLELPMNAVATEPLFSKVLAYDGEIMNPMEGEGPSRDELLAIAASAKSVAGNVTRWDDLAATS
jgi:2-polyprenyl-6-methoxyphenol hydroxylase-like FAD-dependent oxidoreductase